MNLPVQWHNDGSLETDAPLIQGEVRDRFTQSTRARKRGQLSRQVHHTNRLTGRCR
jgi:hypothetical protein